MKEKNIVDQALDISKKRIEIKKSKAEIAEITHKAENEKQELLCQKVDTLRLLLQESRVETDESSSALSSESHNYVYVPILNEAAQEIVAQKIIELVKQF